MTKIWITRTRPAADESAKVWRAEGFQPIVESLLTIEPVAHETFSNEATLIFTSKNGVDHVECGGQSVICVGDATADYARKSGLTDVVSVDGTSADVTDWVRSNISITQPVVHVSGWHVRGSIVEDLRKAGYSARRVKTYRSIKRPIWPDVAVSTVALYSPLAAQTFREAAAGRDVRGLDVICISEATADELSDLKLKSIRIAARPREDELILTAKSS